MLCKGAHFACPFFKAKFVGDIFRHLLQLLMLPVLLHNVACCSLYKDIEMYVFDYKKKIRVYNIGKLSAAFSLRGPLCATFPYYSRHIYYIVRGHSSVT